MVRIRSIHVPLEDVVLTKKEAREYVENLDNWDVELATDLVRVLTLGKYARIQAIHTNYYIRNFNDGKPTWMDVWTGSREDGLFDEQITIPRIAERIWKENRNV